MKNSFLLHLFNIYPRIILISIFNSKRFFISAKLQEIEMQILYIINIFNTFNTLISFNIFLIFIIRGVSHIKFQN